MCGASRLAHARNPANTMGEQAVVLAMASNKCFGAPPLCFRVSNTTSVASGSTSGAVSPICRSITVLLFNVMLLLSKLQFDHLIGAGEQRRRHLEAKRSRRFEVDDQ